MQTIHPQIQLQILDTELDRACMLMKEQVRRDPFSNGSLAIKEKVRYLSEKRRQLVQGFEAGRLDWA